MNAEANSELLTLAIATVDRNVARAMAIAVGVQPEVARSALVVQGSQFDSTVRENGVLVVRTIGFGLSRSRNIACETVGSDYVWFLDDDVSLDRETMERVRSVLISERPDVLIGRVACSNCDGYYKNYKPLPRNARLQVLRVSSIEVVVSTRFVNEHNIRFDERLGLGAEYPSGEENCFLLDCVAAGATLKFLDYAIVAHPCDEPHKSIQQAWQTNGIPHSKGIVARKVGGLLGFAMLVRWMVRAVFAGVSLGHATQAINGYRDKVTMEQG